LDREFWLKRWAEGEIGFHESAVNRQLQRYIFSLCCAGGHVFVPLCGKSLDIGWLLKQGFKVSGVELSESAISELFEGLGIRPQVSKFKNFTAYSADSITIYNGDFFALSSQHLGNVDCVYDRAALVALPRSMREKYTKHLQLISGKATQLVIIVCYGQQKLTGPPFSISKNDLETYYKKSYELVLLESSLLDGGLREFDNARSSAWKLVKRTKE
jgi:thiopurine S-methyltransferase